MSRWQERVASRGTEALGQLQAAVDRLAEGLDEEVQLREECHFRWEATSRLSRRSTTSRDQNLGLERQLREGLVVRHLGSVRSGGRKRDHFRGP
jgi:hypothetical protein